MGRRRKEGVERNQESIIRKEEGEREGRGEGGGRRDEGGGRSRK